MVPVELRLKNFLSYGTEAPPLEFDRFQVACLSGGNGQGKSALLDAMTWALWGQARKSSGKIKPDEDILHIGAREMRVAFVFDTGGSRYRVERLYQESATGKTSSSDLEFQVFQPEADEWRPLTGANQRETQAKIVGTVGLDYETFINSSFLLQGRSDEFTKKSPSERKEILTQILALGRYEALQDRARDRWRTARNEEDRAATEVERLESALEDVDDWKAERDAVQEKIEQETETLEGLRADEKTLAERLATLRAKAQEAESVEGSLDTLAERASDLEGDAEGLREQIENADALLAKSDQIHRDARRRETLAEERDTLDEKRTRHDALSKKVDRLQAKIRDETNAAEKRRDRLHVEQKSDRKTLAAIAEALEKAPALRKKRDAAKAAAERLDTLRQQRDRRQTLDEEIKDLRHALKSHHGELRARQDTLHEQIAEEKEALAEGEDLAEKIEALTQQQADLKPLRQQRDEIEAKGRKLSEAIQSLNAAVETREKSVEKKTRALAKLRDTETGGTCPTCGTDLTAAHRRTVATDQEREIEALRGEIAEKKDAIASRKDDRRVLREQFKELKQDIQQREDAREKLATLQEQQRTRAERRDALAERTEEAQALDRKIEEKNYGQKQRAKRRALIEERKEIDFDEEAYQKASTQAARAEQYQERLDELDEQRERQEALQKATEERAEALAALEEDLDSGAVLGDLPEEVEALNEQRAEVGYDAERYDEVRRLLKGLDGAGERMSELLNAEKNRSSWKKQLTRTQERIENAGKQREKLKEKHQRLSEALEEKPTLEDEQHTLAEERKAHEQEVNQLRSRAGQLAERLDKAERDQKALEKTREERQEADRRRAIYAHLKRAFSKHGIPSLIIEETLPDIEERTNRLLDRLTNGQMSVRLETLRDKQGGGTKETLEINISDAQGVTRAYETYSGGEGFRVNFALRIALAQLMAERSGVRVRTLVIDEGFGTQDEQGIQNLVEAIRTVQDDFQKIVVITHLDELKNAFPVRIEVEKDPALGSTFELNGV